MQVKCKRNLMVSIHCLVYNHEPYLRQCLDGFVMQKTNFQFEVIVHDDASTDNSAEIIREYAQKYPGIIKPIFEKENVYRLKGFAGINEIMDQHMYGKYIAYCEGDDYWCDCNKLQKQVNALEQNPEATMSYTGFYVVDNLGNKIKHVRSDNFMRHSHSGWIFWDLLVHTNFIMTLTTMYRRDACVGIERTPFDSGLFLSATRQGKAIFIPDMTSCYRINPTSIMNTCPHILKAPYYETVYFEIKNVILCDKHTAKSILDHPWKNKVLGYIIGRYIRKSTCRRKFFLLLLRHPFLWLYTIYGVYLRLFRDSIFRNEVNKL